MSSRSGWLLRILLTGTGGLLLALVAISVVGIVTGWQGWGALVGSFTLPELLPGVSWGAVGLFLAAHRPRNALGWVMLVFGIGLLTDRAATVLGGAMDAPPLAVAIVGLAMLVPAPPLTVLPATAVLLFPDGRSASRRWWWVLAPVLVAGVAVAIGTGLGVEAAGGEPWDVVTGAGAVLLIAGVVGLRRRSRSSDDVTRRQIRWVLFSMAVAAGIMVVFFALQRPWIGNNALVLIPLGIGISVHRHQLLDIDRIASRTATYTIVALVLAVTYAALAVGLGALATAVTGTSGDLVVAVSTLAAAGLAQPLRRRVQRAVDRRFDRARYDAAQTIDAFGRSLRDEVSRDAVITSLRDVVARTFGASAVSLVVVEEESS